MTGLKIVAPYSPSALTSRDVPDPTGVPGSVDHHVTCEGGRGETSSVSVNPKQNIKSPSKDVIVFPGGKSFTTMFMLFVN